MSTVQKGRKRSGWLIGLGLILALFAAAAGAWYALCPHGYPVTVQEFERWIDAAVPPGTPKAKVEAWLKSQAIGYDYRLPGGMTAGPKNMISAVIGTKGRCPFRYEELPGRVDPYFIFDDNGRLIQRVVSAQRYSL